MSGMFRAGDEIMAIDGVSPDVARLRVPIGRV